MPHLDPAVPRCAALAAAARGWRVFPLRPGTKTPTGHAEDRCPGTGQCAEGHLKPEQRATTHTDLIHQAWTQTAYGVGIATGPSGLVVLDLDVPKGKTDAPDGAATLRALCERAGQHLPATYTVRTPSGGWHLYYTAPPDARLHNTSRRLGPSIDTRAWGGYVVGAGSTTGGHPYTLVRDLAPAPLPAWLHQHLTTTPTRPHRPVTVQVHRDVSAYAAAALRAEIANVRSAVEGTRNATLVRAARALGRLVASGDLNRVEVEEALNGAGVEAGQPPREVAAAVTSALNWSIRNNPQTVAS